MVSHCVNAVWRIFILKTYYSFTCIIAFRDVFIEFIMKRTSNSHSFHENEHLIHSTASMYYYNVSICATSYEERLKCLVLKEEFPHFMDEVNHSIGTMTAAGKGNDTPLHLSSVNMTSFTSLILPVIQSLLRLHGF